MLDQDDFLLQVFRVISKAVVSAENLESFLLIRLLSSNVDEVESIWMKNHFRRVIEKNGIASI